MVKGCYLTPVMYLIHLPIIQNCWTSGIIVSLWRAIRLENATDDINFRDKFKDDEQVFGLRMHQWRQSQIKWTPNLKGNPVDDNLDFFRKLADWHVVWAARCIIFGLSKQTYNALLSTFRSTRDWLDTPLLMGMHTSNVASYRVTLLSGGSHNTVQWVVEAFW